MRVLLQHTETRRFFSSTGVWLDGVAEGRSFSNVSVALSFCREHAIFSANVILAFDDADLNVCLGGPRPPR
jgi:hypothetical protein